MQKLTKLTLKIECPSHHLTSWRKSVQIWKPSAQILKVFYQHEIAEKKNDLGDKNEITSWSC